jgi:hypothetical protein
MTLTERARLVRSPILEKIRKETPLETRLSVLNKMMFIDLLSTLGFRKDKYWTPEEDPLLSKLCEHAQKLTNMQLEDIKEWEEDGRP